VLRGLTEEEHGALDWFESDEYTKVYPAHPRAQFPAPKLTDVFEPEALSRMRSSASLGLADFSHAGMRQGLTSPTLGRK